jgi:beta-phosphoglucomutase-like phosphatase (HAD superfamily)
MVKEVIFDMDGTLVDSVDVHAKAWQDACPEAATCFYIAKS